MNLIGRIELVTHLLGRLNAVAGGVYAPEEPDVTYVVKDKEGVVVPAELVAEESTSVRKLIRLLISISDTNSTDELEEIEREIDALLNETDPYELGNLAGHTIVNKIRLAQSYRDDIIAAIEAKGITAEDKQPLRTVADLIDQIIRETKTVAPTAEEQIVTPSEGVYGLEAVIVEAASLDELNVWPTTEEQVILPPEGYIGFSKVTVDAVPDYGGDGGGDAYLPDADDTEFGDEYTDGDVPTGDYDYTDDGDYIPGIPDGDHQVLFDTELKETTTLSFRAEFLWAPNNPVLGGYGEFDYQIVTTMPCRGYIVKGTLIYGKPPYNYCHQASLWLAFTGQVGTVKVKETTAENWSDYGGDGVSTANGTFKEINMSFNTNEDNPENAWVVSGAPCFDVGTFTGSTKEEVENAYHNAAAAIFDSYESGEIQQYVAVVSESQIRSDGSVINNVDGSSMSIYELDTKGDNTWKLIGTTDGRDYPVQSFTPVWNSGEILDMSGESVIQNPSADPVPEMTGGMVANPLERNETYTIEGNSLNALVGAAQKVVGSTEPLTPDEAKAALDEYYSQPKAEEVLW